MSSPSHPSGSASVPPPGNSPPSFSAFSRKPFKIGAVLGARCPACHLGQVNQGFFGIRPCCSECGYNFYPENGFYLGAIALSFLITALLTIPPMVILKLMEVDLEILVAFPFVEFLVLGSLLMFYAKILWLHLEYRVTSRLNAQDSRPEN